MSSASERRTALRRRIGSGPMLVVPGAGDGLGARLAQAAGFEAVYMSGYYVEGTFGQADVGLLGMSEMAARAAQICDASDLPVLADADTGYGNAVNVIRTVRAFERAGVAALQLEDQELPKKCGSFPGKRILPVHEMTGKLRAAVDARSDANLQIIARSDAVPSEGIAGAVERLCRYREAGADLLMIHGPYDEGQAQEIIRQLPGPLVYLNAESLTMPMIPVPRLATFGAAVVIFPLSMLLAATRAMQAALEVIKRDGTTLPLLGNDIMKPSEFNDLVGIAGIRDAESRYAG